MTECIKIKCDDCKFQENCVDYGWEGCKKFTQKAHEPMTNEEWLRSATTEELANILAIQKCDGCNDEPYDEEHSTCKYCMMQKREQIMEWLKQPHKE